MADSKEPQVTVKFYESLGVAPFKNEGLWTTGVETFEEKPEGYDEVTLRSMAHPGSQDLNPEALEELEIELDDPYLELFDRINQLEMDIKELSAKFDKYINTTQEQRAYDMWVLRGMPVGRGGGRGASMIDGGVNNINSQQLEFKFFE